MSTICVVSNKQDLKENYSKFIDSCDVVVRINKLDNLETGLVGTRTDIVILFACDAWMQYTEEQMHLQHIMKNAKRVYLVDGSKNSVLVEKLKSVHPDFVKMIPEMVARATVRMTTFTKALVAAYYLNPNDKIYFLGDTDARVRAYSPRWIKHDDDNDMMKKLLAEEIITPILGDPTKYEPIRE